MDVPFAFGLYRFAAYLAGKPEAGEVEGYKRRALGLSGALRGFESIN